MENASKAIIMAGGILIAIIIMSLLVMLFSQIGSVYQGDTDSKLIEQIAKENRKFDKYNNDKGLYGSELLSLANLVAEYNGKLLDSVDGNKNDPTYDKNKITVEVHVGSILIEEVTDPNNNNEPVKNKYGKQVKKYITNGLSGWYNINDLKILGDEFDELQGEGYTANLTGFKSTPFKLINTEYYPSGLIKIMKFEQTIG